MVIFHSYVSLPEGTCTRLKEWQSKLKQTLGKLCENVGSSTFVAKTSDQRVLFKQISLKCQVPTVVNSLPFYASMQYTQFHCNAPSCTCGRKLLERDSKASYRLRKTASVKLLTAQAFYPWTQPTLWHKARLGRCFCLYDWKDCSTCPSRKFHVAFVIEMHSILSKTWIQRFQIHKKALRLIYVHISYNHI